MPISTKAEIAARLVISPLGIKCPSTNELAAMAAPTATGAPNGNRRRNNSGSVIASIASTSNQRGPSGPFLCPCLTTTSARPTPTPTRMSASNQYRRASEKGFCFFTDLTVLQPPAGRLVPEDEPPLVREDDLRRGESTTECELLRRVLWGPDFAGPPRPTTDPHRAPR